MPFLKKRQRWLYFCICNVLTNPKEDVININITSVVVSNFMTDNNK